MRVITIDGDLSLAHTFQQRGLRSGCCPVDLIGQQDVGKGRSGHKLKLACLLIKDANPGDIAGQQVGRALQAPKVGV